MPIEHQVWEPYSYINETNVEFNDAVKKLMKRLKYEHEVWMNVLKREPNIDDLQLAQDNIRAYILKNINQLTVKKNKNGKIRLDYPDYYALLCALICDLDLCHSWKDVYEQINPPEQCNEHRITHYKDVIDKTHMLTWYKEILDDEKKYYCFCSHACMQAHLGVLKNDLTGMGLVIGCNCIDKTGITTKSAFLKQAIKNQKEMQDVYTKRKIMEENFRPCMACNELIISKKEPDTVELCPDCTRKRDFRPCMTCLKDVIHKTCPEDYTACKACKDEEKQEFINYNKAINSTINFGQYKDKGKTYVEISKENKKYLIYLLDNTDVFSDDDYTKNKYIRKFINNLKK